MLVKINDRHIGALARVQHRDRAPDARIAAGDDGDQSGQLAAAAIIGREELRLQLHRRLAAGLVELLRGKGAGGIVARPGLGVLGAALFRAALLGAGRLLVEPALLLLNIALLAAGLIDSMDKARCGDGALLHTARDGAGVFVVGVFVGVAQNENARLDPDGPHYFC